MAQSLSIAVQHDEILDERRATGLLAGALAFSARTPVDASTAFLDPLMGDEDEDLDDDADAFDDEGDDLEDEDALEDDEDYLEDDDLEEDELEGDDDDDDDL